MPISPNPK